MTMHTRSVEYGSQVDSTQLGTHLVHCLSRANPLQVRVAGNRIFFKGGVFRWVSNWNVLIPFGHGEIEVDSDSHRVNYSLSYSQWLTLGTIFVFLIGTFILFTSSKRDLWFLPLIWVWLVGINVVIGISRFEGFIRKCIETAPQTVQTRPLMK